MSLHAFADESFERSYLMAVVVIAGADVATSRSRSRQLRAHGAARFHMSSESDRQRDSALALICDLPATLFVVEVSPDTVRRLRRSRAINAVVDECCRLGAMRLVFELDVSVIDRDRRTVARALHEGVNADALTYNFVRGSAEPLLWLPDAVAWAWARGGPWRSKLPEDTRHIRV